MDNAGLQSGGFGDTLHDILPSASLAARRSASCQVLLPLEIIIMHLDTEDYHRANRRYHIRYHQRPVIQGKALQDKKNTTKPKHTESRHCNTISRPSTDSSYSLRQITEHHTNTRAITYYI